MLDAMRNGEFWIITHDDLFPTVEARVTEHVGGVPREGS